MFIILSYQRSGTHLLAHLLNSHPDLTCYDEILFKGNGYKAWKKQYRLGYKDLNKLKWNEGCIIMYTHLLRLTKEELKLIEDSKVIHLTRNDTEAHYKSLFGVWGEIPTDRRKKWMRKRIARLRAEALKNRFRHFYSITYEEICKGKEIKQYRNKELLEFLGVKSKVLTTNLPKK